MKKRFYKALTGLLVVPLIIGAGVLLVALSPLIPIVGFVAPDSINATFFNSSKEN